MTLAQSSLSILEKIVRFFFFAELWHNQCFHTLPYTSTQLPLALPDAHEDVAGRIWCMVCACVSACALNFKIDIAASSSDDFFKSFVQLILMQLICTQHTHTQCAHYINIQEWPRTFRPLGDFIGNLILNKKFLIT